MTGPNFPFEPGLDPGLVDPPPDPQLLAAMPFVFGEGFRPMLNIRNRDDIPRGGMSRRLALLTVATGLLSANRISGPIAFTLAPNPTTSAAFPYANDGMWRNSAASLTWTMTGQADIPPGGTRRYLLLLGAGGDTQVAYVGDRGAGGGDWVFVPNGLEALIAAMNSGSLLSVGFTIVGTFEIRNNTATPYTPGTAFPASPFLAFVMAGFPSVMLLDDTDVGTPVVPIRL